MIPLFDDDSDRRTFPVVNYLFIAISIYVFIVYQPFGHNLAFTYSYATVPGEILTGHDIVTAATNAHDPATGQEIVSPGLGVTPLPVWFTLITSMFLHGGLAHLAGNMLYFGYSAITLKIRWDIINYFFFYLLCGVIASLTHVFASFIFGENLAYAKHWCIGRYLCGNGWLSVAFSNKACYRVITHIFCAGACICRSWPVDIIPGSQRHRNLGGGK